MGVHPLFLGSRSQVESPPLHDPQLPHAVFQRFLATTGSPCTGSIKPKRLAFFTFTTTSPDPWWAFTQTASMSAGSVQSLNAAALFLPRAANHASNHRHPAGLYFRSNNIQRRSRLPVSSDAYAREVSSGRHYPPCGPTRAAPGQVLVSWSAVSCTPGGIWALAACIGTSLFVIPHDTKVLARVRLQLPFPGGPLLPLISLCVALPLRHRASS